MFDVFQHMKDSITECYRILMPYMSLPLVPFKVSKKEMQNSCS